jgi:O-antigen/teichoic acid export membrane protein
MLVRAPVYVFQGVAASLLPNFTLLGAANRRQLRHVLRRTSGVLATVGLAIVVGVAALGPIAMRIIYGDEFSASRASLVLLACSIAFYLAGATFLQALLALHRVLGVALAWSAAGVVLCVVYVAASGSELSRISVALFVATAANAVIHRLLLAQALHERAL